MEETITLPNEINRLCRACMTVAQDCEQFFKNALVEGSILTDLGEMFQDLTSKGLLNDGLPEVLCDICVERLENSFSFKKQCEDVHSNLKELLTLFNGDNSITNCPEGEFQEPPLLESKPEMSIPEENLESLTCKVCNDNFRSVYQLSKHLLDHNKDKSLLQRYEDNCDKDYKGLFSNDNTISDDIVALINDRKSECLLLSKSMIMTDFGNQKVESSIKEEIESTEDIIGDGESKTVVIFPSDNDEIKSPKLINLNRSVSNMNFNRRLSLPTTCKHCGKKFSSKNKCKLHYCSEKNKQVKDEGLEDFTTENPMNCDLCNKVFPNHLMVSIHFIFHILIEESIKNSDLLQEWLFCNICGQVFQSEQEIQVHKDTNHAYQSLTFLCDKCNTSFEKDTDLILHEDQEHADTDMKDSYACPICNETFENKGLLLDHGLNHLMKKIYCRVCRLEFCTQASLNDHMKVHPRYKHVCTICGKCLSSNSALKSHMMGIHNQDALYMCTTCGKCFKTSNRLRIHREIHSANKKFMCSYCGYRSHKSGDLKLHLRTHTSEHPYKCTFANCNRMFKTSSHFNQHIRHHLDIKQYQCPYCLRRFSHSYTLKLHKMRHTGEKPHSCIACPARFRRKDHLRIHMKQHQK